MNEGRDQHRLNNGAIFSEAQRNGPNSGFLEFNSNLREPLRQVLNHGAATQQGDSGSGVFACIANPSTPSGSEVVWVGAVSFIYDKAGHYGGAASGTMVEWLNKTLPGNRSGEAPASFASRGERRHGGWFSDVSAETPAAH